MNHFKLKQELARETRSLVLSFGVAFFPELVAHFKGVYGNNLQAEEIINTIDKTIRKMEREQEQML